MLDGETTWGAFDTVDGAFAVSGLDVRVHRGRSVVSVSIEERTHFLKRFQSIARQPFKGHVARGLHELRMIDWLAENGFRGPKVVRRGSNGRGFWGKRLYFLMEEVPEELPLEAASRRHRADSESLLAELATFSAKIHDAGFTHTDFSERHILVGRNKDKAWTFRLIDLERARVGRINNRSAAADLATLAASIADTRLRARIEGSFVEDYIAKRTTLAASVDFPALLKQAKPTKTFY